MAQRSPIARLTDIVEACALIRSEMWGVPLDAFEANARQRWIVERGVEIVSEASRRLPDELKARRPEIPWTKVAGIGNVLRHNYENIGRWCVTTCRPGRSLPRRASGGASRRAANRPASGAAAAGERLTESPDATEEQKQTK